MTMDTPIRIIMPSSSGFFTALPPPQPITEEEELLAEALATADEYTRKNEYSYHESQDNLLPVTQWNPPKPNAIQTHLLSPPALDDSRTPSPSKVSPSGTIYPDDSESLNGDDQDNIDADRMIAEMLRRLNTEDDDKVPLFKSAEENEPKKEELVSPRGVRHIDPLQRFLRADVQQRADRYDPMTNFMDQDLRINGDTKSVYMDPIDGLLAEESSTKSSQRATAAPTLSPPVRRSSVVIPERRSSAIPPPRNSSSFGMTVQVRRRDTIDSGRSAHAPHRDAIVRMKVMVTQKSGERDKEVILRMNVNASADIRTMIARIKAKCQTSHGGEGLLSKGQRLYYFNGEEQVRLSDDREWSRLKQLTGDRILRILVQ